MTTNARSARVRGRHSQPAGLAAKTSVAETTTGAGSWLFSPVRVEAVEAEQRALEGFERIASAMPIVARTLTAELIPDGDDGVIRTTRRAS